MKGEQQNVVIIIVTYGEQSGILMAVLQEFVNVKEILGFVDEKKNQYNCIYWLCGASDVLYSHSLWLKLFAISPLGPHRVGHSLWKMKCIII